MQELLTQRTKQIGLNVIKLVASLPSNSDSLIISRQLIGCSTSIGSNYRAACRAKPNPDFINKLKIVEEETDETLYWLEILEENGQISTTQTEVLKKEWNKILSIMVSSIKTAKNNEAQRVRPSS